MAASATTTVDPETKETVSQCTSLAEKGAHTFEIVGYNLKTNGMRPGKSIQSGTFTVGGCDWVLRFYPNYLGGSSSDLAFIHIELLTKNVEVRARYEVWLVDRPSGSLGTLWPAPAPDQQQQVFGPGSKDVRSASVKMSRTELEASRYIHADCLTMRAVVTVIQESKLSETVATASVIEVPPLDIMAHLGKLLEEKEGADVTFSVGGESFAAHKFLLAARSPVFKAELCGPMRTRARCVAVEDMQPEVFRVLLHFAYTDSLPDDLGELEGDDYGEMIRHLLVAADRYAMDRLKLMCQNILGRSLDVENVATTLGLADQYNCNRLKDVCIEFMIDLEDKNAVMETKGYANLRRSCPSVIVEVYERTNKRRRICK